MKLVFKRTVFSDGTAGWKLRSPEFDNLRKVVNRAISLNGDPYADIRDPYVRFKKEENSYIIFNPADGDVTRKNIDDLIDILKDAKEDLTKEETIIVEI